MATRILPLLSALHCWHLLSQFRCCSGCIIGPYSLFHVISPAVYLCFDWARLAHDVFAHGYSFFNRNDPRQDRYMMNLTMYGFGCFQTTNCWNKAHNDIPLFNSILESRPEQAQNHRGSAQSTFTRLPCKKAVQLDEQHNRADTYSSTSLASNTRAHRPINYNVLRNAFGDQLR